MKETFLSQVKKLILFENNQFFSIQGPNNYFPVKNLNGYIDVSLKDVSNHFDGGTTISIQPIQYKTNLCKYGAIDFDTNDISELGIEKLLEQVRKTAAFIKQIGISDFYIEYSGKKGFHIYFFSSSPIPASIMRNFLRYVTVNSGYITDEIYPSADYISHTYYPRPLKLFYGVHKKTGNRSGFISLDNVSFTQGHINVSSHFDILSSIKQIDSCVFSKYQLPILSKNYINLPVNWELIPQHHPPCISSLIENGACSVIDYNKNNLTLARYVSDRNKYNPNFNTEYLRHLATLMAYNSSTHPTSKSSSEDKIQNMESIINSGVWTNYKWKCSFIWSIKPLAKHCAFCPLNVKAYGIKEEKMLPIEIKAAPSLAIPKNHELVDTTPTESIKNNDNDIFCVNTYKTNIDELLSSVVNYVCIEVVNDRLLIYTNELYIFDHSYIEALKQLLEDRNIIKISYNMIAVCNFLYFTPVGINSYFDIYLAYKLVNCGLNLKSDVHEISLHLLGIAPAITNDLISYYGYYMPDYPYIRKKLIGLLQENDLIECFKTETAHIKVSSEIESTGFLFDVNTFNYHSTLIKDELDFLKSKLSKYEIPYQDSQAFIKWLKDHYNYSYSDLTKEHLLEMPYPEVRLFIRYRALLSQFNRFSSNILSYIKPSGRLKTKVNQLGTVTGRVTTEEYSTVNIPKGPLRECFIAQDNYLLLDVDFISQELVILAQECQEKLLIESLNNDLDIHSLIASLILKKPVQEISAHERNLAKAFVYGFSYGVGDNRVMNDLKNKYGIELDILKVKELKKEFFNVFPGIKNRLDNISNLSNLPQTSVISSLSKRKRFFSTKIPTFNNLVNNPIQMCAVDIFKLAASNIYYYKQEQNYRAFFVNEVYDQLTLEVHKDDIEDVTRLVVNEMRKASRQYLPDMYMDITVSVSQRWYDCKQ